MGICHGLLDLAPDQASHSSQKQHRNSSKESHCGRFVIWHAGTRSQSIFITALFEGSQRWSNVTYFRHHKAGPWRRCGSEDPIWFRIAQNFLVSTAANKLIGCSSTCINRIYRTGRLSRKLPHLRLHSHISCSSNMLRLLTWGLVALAAGAQAAIPLAVSPSHLDPGTPFSGRPGVKPFTLRLGHDTASVCNSSTPGTSGFIASKDRLGGKSSIFFWFFESKHDPTSDPVILWMTGYDPISAYHLSTEVQLTVIQWPRCFICGLWALDGTRPMPYRSRGRIHC